jgi:glycosyltransferase involved in cell wall biosynthesis
MKLSILIPAYNEVATIRQVLERVAAVDLGPIEKELVVVNDQSTDGTQMILEQYQAAGRIRLVHTAQRRGKGHALRTGLAQATGELVIFQDADLELNPEEYPRLLAPLLEGRAAVVYGSRFLTNGLSGSRLNRCGNWLVTTLVNWFYGARLTDVETCYKLFRREFLLQLGVACDRFDFEPEVTIKTLKRGVTIHEVPITYQPRTIAEGKKMRWVAGFDAMRVILKLRWSQ